MDKFLVPVKPSPEEPSKPSSRRTWHRSLIELTGRLEPKYRRSVSDLLMQSYSELRAFQHLYHIEGRMCRTHLLPIMTDFDAVSDYGKRKGVSGLDFDNKGIYLASVTKLGCLLVHDFDSLCCQSNGPLLRLKEDEAKHVLHLSSNHQLDSVRWNLANQDEVACTSMKRNEVLIYDISYISSEPSEVLKTKSRPAVSRQKGFSDIAFISCENSRVLASDTEGVVNLWDRRMGTLPCLEFATNSRGSLNSIQINVDNQIIFGAGKDGFIHAWDLRGGKSSSIFKGTNEVSHLPLTSLKISSMLEKIKALKMQSAIVSKEIHSINLDPCSPHQLAFHLDDGWSGVLNLFNLVVTHVHCPPPPWLDWEAWSDRSHLRKPSWLPTNSIYVAPSSTDNGIHVLDFYPDSSSYSHVDYKDAYGKSRIRNEDKHEKRYISLSERVTACAVHPLNSTIVAGTELSSLLMISQPHKSYKGDE